MSYPDSWACFNCGTPGHLAANCPTAAAETVSEAPSDRPHWCGGCDPRTRLLDLGDHSARCHRCWAWLAKGTRPGMILPQHKRCGGCAHLVYAWDSFPCGHHQEITKGYSGYRTVIEGKLEDIPPISEPITEPADNGRKAIDNGCDQSPRAIP